MLLAGLILGCFLHLAAAQQQRFLVLSDPPSPQRGQDVTLSLQGGPSNIETCQWTQEDQRGRKTVWSISPGNGPSPTESQAARGKRTLRPDCSLQITNLEASDEGNYSVTVTGLGQRQGDAQAEKKTYQASFKLQLSGKDQQTQKVLQVELRPRFPSSGQDVTLTPKEIPAGFRSCQWFRETRSGRDEPIPTSPPDQQQSQDQQRKTVDRDCSLTIRSLQKSDSGTYKFTGEAPSQHQHTPGAGTGQQEAEGQFQIYRGETYLEVNDPSKTDPRVNSSCGALSVGFGAWIVAATFLGSVAW